MISEAAHSDCNMIWGVDTTKNLDDEMIITVIATGFDKDDAKYPNYINDIKNYTPKMPIGNR
jgi:cell division GTPase FtsZ